MAAALRVSRRWIGGEWLEIGPETPSIDPATGEVIRLSERLRNVRPGPAADPASDVGPPIDEHNVGRVDGIVNAISRDVDRPLRVSRRLDVGLIPINSWANLQFEFEEGGVKASGVGRLGGLVSVDDFLDGEQITQDYSPEGARV